MNQSISGSLTLGKAIIGFSNYITAEGLTIYLVNSYKRVLDQRAAYSDFD